MRFTFVMILFFLYSLPSKSQTLIAITHVNIVDVKNEKIISDKTIILKNDKIEKIGSNLKLPSDIKIIQGKDKFLIPGLWDMHYHNIDDESTEATDSTITPLLIANGITGVRDMFALKSGLRAFTADQFNSHSFRVALKVFARFDVGELRQTLLITGHNP
jgi:dihydroorotase-like cyclic amidohydrolase